MGEVLNLRHLDGHLLCAIDTETTGLIPGKHDIYQICILPLDNFLRPRKDILPFYTYLQPRRPENIDPKARVGKQRVEEVMKIALDAWKVADLLEEWFEKIKLPMYRKIEPLGFNYAAFDMPFIVDWLGKMTYDHIFHFKIRDVFLYTQFMNDRASFKAEPPPYTKQDLAWVCATLGVENPNAHDAMSDCIATVECYKRMIHRSL